MNSEDQDSDAESHYGVPYQGWFEEMVELEASESSMRSPHPEAVPVHSELILDIYAERQNHIDKCIRDLENELARAATTIVWSDKLTYESDKHFIAEMDRQTVCMRACIVL